ncbi:MAG: hypothetical protein M1825_005308 [Sarcosagium campestre]|nr:MAG: hypothetical protein M1825_005308 [Sarcosagium campestre]
MSNLPNPAGGKKKNQARERANSKARLSGANAPGLSISASTSTSTENVRTPTARDTPRTNLRQLAGLIQHPATPSGRAPAPAVASTRPSIGRTPGVPARAAYNVSTTGTNPTQRATPSRRGGGGATIPLTPHAIRARQQRRAAALTPGRDRRRSGRAQQQRETPRDLLRNLSEVLAPVSKPVISSPNADSIDDAARRQQEQRRRRSSLFPDDDIFEDELDMPPPRPSIPFDDSNDDDDDSVQLQPPRLSMGPEYDDNLTQHSVEAPRRAYNDKEAGRFPPRNSLGSTTRFSDRFADLEELRANDLASSDDDDDNGYDDMGMQGPDDYSDDDGNDLVGQRDDDTMGDDNIRRDLQQAFRDEVGRRADLAQDDGNDDDTTFAFTVPQREEEEEEEDGEDQDMPDVAASSQIDAAAAAAGAAFDTDIPMEDDAHAETDTQHTRRGRPKGNSKQPKEVKISRHGIPYPSLPTAVVKKMALNFARSSGGGGGSGGSTTAGGGKRAVVKKNSAKISKEALAAIMQASDMFLEQVSDDVAAYAKHAGRMTIEDSDMVTLMKREFLLADDEQSLVGMRRQRQVNATTTPFALAQRLLPRELLHDLRMPPPGKLKKAQRQRQSKVLEPVVEEREQ